MSEGDDLKKNDVEHDGKPEDLWLLQREVALKVMDRVERAAQIVELCAVWLAGLLVLGVAGAVIRAFQEEGPDVGLPVLLSAVVALPVIALVPAVVWGFGALLEAKSRQLDIASLEAELDDEETER